MQQRIEAARGPPCGLRFCNSCTSCAKLGGAESEEVQHSDELVADWRGFCKTL